MLANIKKSYDDYFLPTLGFPHTLPTASHGIVYVQTNTAFNQHPIQPRCRCFRFSFAGCHGGVTLSPLVPRWARRPERRLRHGAQGELTSRRSSTDHDLYPIDHIPEACYDWGIGHCSAQASVSSDGLDRPLANIILTKLDITIGFLR